MWINENDRFAAAWLRQLYPEAVVDERSISDVRAVELLPHLGGRCHFFGGIGGWEYALRLAGWPADRPVWTGSCPCQSVSCAGKRRGAEDRRHLWPEFYRLISFHRPATIFGEQTASGDGREWLDGVCLDLEGLGYAVASADLCAAGEGAPHIRQRLYWVAYATSRGQRIDGRTSRSTGHINERVETGGMGDTQNQRWNAVGNHGNAAIWSHGATGVASYSGGLVNANSAGCGEQCGPVAMGQEHLAAECAGGGYWSEFDVISCADGKARRVESGTFPLAHGVSARVGRLRGYGNAIVPQVAARFVRAFLECTRGA